MQSSSGARGSSLFGIVLFSLLLLLGPSISPPAAAQSPATQESTPITFSRYFPIYSGSSQAVNNLNTGISVQTQVGLDYGESMLLTASSSLQYAQAGTSGGLTISESNDVAFLQVSGSANFNFLVAGITVSSIPYPVNFQYAVPVSAGSSQNIVLGTFSVLTVNAAPGVTIQVNMQPAIQWTPVLTGNYVVNGPASIQPPSMTLNGGTSSATISFSDSQPTNVYLSNPQLTLYNLQLVLNFPVLIDGATIGSASVPVVAANTYYVTASTSTTKLLSFDPNYYLLYSQLESSLGALGASIQQLQASYNSLSASFQQIQSSFSSLSSGVQQLQQSYNSISSQVTSLTGNVSNLTSSLGLLKSAENALSSDQQSFRQSLNNMTSTFNTAIANLQSGFNTITSTGSTQSSSNSQSSLASFLLSGALGFGIGAGIALGALVLRKRLAPPK